MNPLPCPGGMKNVLLFHQDPCPYPAGCHMVLWTVFLWQVHGKDIAVGPGSTSHRRSLMKAADESFLMLTSCKPLPL